MQPDYIQKIQEKRQLANKQNEKLISTKLMLRSGQKNGALVGDTVSTAVREAAEELKKHHSSTKITVQLDDSEVAVNNLPDLALRADINSLLGAIRSLEESLKPESVELSGVIDALKELGAKLDTLPRSLPIIPAPKDSVKVTNLSEFGDLIKPVITAIEAIDVSPIVNVEKQEQPEIDLAPLLKAIENLGRKFGKVDIPKVDLEPLLEATNQVTETIRNLRFPVPNYVLPFLGDNGEATQVQLNTDGSLPIVAKTTEKYSISAISEDASYKYYFFEDASLNYYIMRKTLATKVFEYTKGVGGYESVYVNATSGPSGTPVWGTYGETF
jgi:hypothetical protein